MYRELSRGAMLMSLDGLRPSHVLRLMLLCLCGVFLLPVVFSSKVSAFSNPIAVTNQTDTIHFPGSIDFTMTATDTAGSISDASIYITYKDTQPAVLTRQYSVPVTRPAQNITLHWHEITGGDNFHPPGTPVEYFWYIQDTTNHLFSSAAQDFTTIDTRFSWQHLSEGLLQVNWYNRPLDFGQLLLKDANDNITRISSEDGGGLLHPINLWAYANNQDFHGALAPGAYEWVGGEAHPLLHEAFISVIDSNDDTLIRDMPHELTHLVFHQLVAQGPFPPTWFDEGLAVYNQLFHEPEMRARFDQALRDHSLIRLNQISDQFPADGDQAYLAYAQSWDLIGYMYSTFGQAKMVQLIKQMNNSQTSLDQDLTQSLGEDEIHLENQWLLHLGQPGVIPPDQLTPTPKAVAQTSQTQSTVTDNTAPIFITAGTLLILLPIIGIVAILVYQRRKRQQVLAAEAVGGAPGHPIPGHPTPGHPQGVSLPWTSGPPAQYPEYPSQQVPQTYMPFFYSMPEQDAGPHQDTREGPHPSSTPLPPLRGPEWGATNWAPTAEEDFSEYGEPTIAPFGPFQENLNTQPKKKVPQE